MKDILSRLFAENISEKEIFYFVNDKIPSPDPHYYICIKKTPNDILIFSVCTTKIETIKRYVAAKRYPSETIVHIHPADSPLPKDSYINCNQYHEFTVNEFKQKHAKRELKLKGILPDKYYEQIISGLCLSPDIEEELKDLLNDI